MRTIEIEIDGKNNNNVMFLPLQRVIRGRFDMDRLADRGGEGFGSMESKLGGRVIPGQRLGIDLDRCEGYVHEPLRDPDHWRLREAIEKKLNMRLEDPLVKSENVHVPTWLYWMKRLVDGGMAKVVKGVLPEKIDGEPKRQFFFRGKPDRADGKRVEELEALVARQGEQIDKLLAVLQPKA